MHRFRKKSNLKNNVKLLKRQTAEFDALFNSIGEGIITTDAEAKIDRVNQKALDILGFKREDLIGKWFPKAIEARNDLGNVINVIDRPITKALMTGMPVTGELNYINAIGVPIPIKTTCSPIILENEPIGSIQLFREISEEKIIEESKDEFLSITSHQLRTPLTSIRLFTEMILAKQVGPLTHSQHEYLKMIEESTIRMIKLVGMTLNVSRIELNRLKVDTKPLIAEDLIKEIANEVKPLAEEKHVSLHLNLPKKKVSMRLDPMLFHEIMHNLLTNAIRYSSTQEGKVEVGIEHGKDSHTFYVKDNGIGIPQKDEKRIFSRFFRADNAIKTIGEGTGLGLYLVNRIIKETGGKVTFTSKEGYGTTFYVKLPLLGMKSKDGDKGLST